MGRFSDMRLPLVSLALVSALGLAACDRDAPKKKPAQVGATAQHIAWREGDVEDAFAEAAESGKPVLLYWGAVWCPPCNRLKAGLFQDPEFVARTQDFVPVYLDGDSKGAQAWGERFGIRGYPTLIVLSPDRTEITRLSGGDPEQVETALASLQHSRAPAKVLLEQALDKPRRLKPADWAVLAEYSWGQDEGRLAPLDQTSHTLERLAEAAPTPVLRRRFTLLSLVALPAETKTLSAASRERVEQALAAVLASPQESRANRQALIYSSDRLVSLASADEVDRTRLSEAAIKAGDRLYADSGLGLSDRVTATNIDISLFRDRAGEEAAAPPALMEKVRQRVAWMDGAAKTPYERQSVISTAADLLAEVDDKAGAERLLKAELERSATPYYYMPSIADLAEARGDKAEAVRWLRKGYETAEGPATRTQWGALYVQGLIRLTPRDKAGIEAAAGQVIGELASQPNSYHQRTRQRFDGLDKALTEWSAANGGGAVLTRLRGRVAQACRAQADVKAREACQGWLKVA